MAGLIHRLANAIVQTPCRGWYNARARRRSAGPHSSKRFTRIKNAKLGLACSTSGVLLFTATTGGHESLRVTGRRTDLVAGAAGVPQKAAGLLRCNLPPSCAIFGLPRCDKKLRPRSITWTIGREFGARLSRSSFSASSLVIELRVRAALCRSDQRPPLRARVQPRPPRRPFYGSLKFNRGFALYPRSKEVKG